MRYVRRREREEYTMQELALSPQKPFFVEKISYEICKKKREREEYTMQDLSLHRNLFLLKKYLQVTPTSHMSSNDSRIKKIFDCTKEVRIDNKISLHSGLTRKNISI
jgi:hypothetical protein